MKYGLDSELFRIRLKNLINSLGISDSRFAERTGITNAGLSQILGGRRLPAFETLNKIHMATGCSLDYLFGIKIKK